MMEAHAEAFYLNAAKQSTDTAHQDMENALSKKYLHTSAASQEESKQKRQFILTWVQPGLAGLMDGSFSTLAQFLPLHLQHRIHRPHFLLGLPHLSGQELLLVANRVFQIRYSVHSKMIVVSFKRALALTLCCFLISRFNGRDIF